MNNNHALLLWLAASRFSVREINDFFEWIAKEGPRAATAKIDDLRNNEPPRLHPTAPSKQSQSRKNEPDDLRIREHMSMIREVEKLLLEDVGLSKADAVKVIMSELRDVETTYGYISSPNKRSFRSWLARVGEDVSDSRIVHVASKIRYQIINGSKPVSDWPI